MALRVFPPTFTQPRKSSLKKPRTSEADGSTGDFKGVAFQLHTTRPSAGVVQAANDRIKHSLFCEPATADTNTMSHASFRKQLRVSKRSSVASDSTEIRCDSPVDVDEDLLSPLPENSSFGSPSSQSRLSPGVERPTLPLNVSTEAHPGTATPVSPGGDRLSPLPDTGHFAPAASPAKPEYPAATHPLRSVSPGFVLGCSPESAVPPYSPPDPARQRSLFPVWDPMRPLNEQQYYPLAHSAVLPSEKATKVVSPNSSKRQTLPPLDLQHIEPSATVVVGYEHIPVANSSDLLEVWNASCDRHKPPGRKALFRMFQPRDKGTSLAIGVSADSVLWSMKKDKPSVAVQSVDIPELFIVSKHPPGKPDHEVIAQLALPDKDDVNQDSADQGSVSIFPHQAVEKAIDGLAATPAGSALAQNDPNGHSPEALRLAQRVVSEAHQRCRARLIRTARQRHSLGAVTATYNLEHPSLGKFPITVTRSTADRNSRDPRAKISLHHPTATLAAVDAETLVLAFLDFARDACVLDVPGLMSLEGSHIIDIVVCALSAVAVIENDAIMTETIAFAAPPKSPLPLAKRASRNSVVKSDAAEDSKRSNGLLRRNKKKKKEEIELPALTQGALALLGFSFKAAVWTLELGVKVTAGVIIGTSRVVSKEL